jgi:uracil permease
MGPIVALIGLELAKLTVAGGSTGANIMSDTTTTGDIVVFAVTLGVAVFGSLLFRGFFAIIPILVALVCGYITALCFGMIDFSPGPRLSSSPCPASSSPGLTLRPF